MKSERDSVFTRHLINNVEEIPHRPAILVSSSSWTEDEDFQILIDAFDGTFKVF